MRKCEVCGSEETGDQHLVLIDGELLCGPCSIQKLVAESEQEEQLWADLRAGEVKDPDDDEPLAADEATDCRIRAGED